MSDGNVNLLLLLAGVGGILIVATLAGAWLRWRLAPGGDLSLVENLNSRVAAWWGMVAVLLLAFIGGKAGVTILFALCSFAALREFLTLTHTRQLITGQWRRRSSWCCPSITIWYGSTGTGFYSIFIPVYAFLLLPIIAALRGDTIDFLDRIAETQWALMICVFCLSHVPALLYLSIPGFQGGNVLLIAFLVFVVQLSDVMQYISGRLLGRRRVAPGALAIEDCGRHGRWGGHGVGGRRRALVDDAVHRAAGGIAGADRHADGVLGRFGDVGDQARPGREGLGAPDPRPWRLYRST